jgi:hypothetical protein
VHSVLQAQYQLRTTAATGSPSHAPVERACTASSIHNHYCALLLTFMSSVTKNMLPVSRHAP